NDTTISEFVLLGFGEFSKPQVHLFSLFLVIYILSMVGNFLIIILVVINQHFHTPMYIFLVNLPFMEACCSSAVIPKMLSILLTGDNYILFKSCFIQFYIYACLEGTECCLLAMMSYDRRQKAFSTCSSHLIVVCLYYGTSKFPPEPRNQHM
ncbi:OR6C3: Olfactory receptor, partial [Crotalus adamanteus]